MIYRYSASLVILSCCMPCIVAQTPAPKAQPLFNGQNFSGWQKYSNDKKIDLQQLIKMDPFDKHIIIKGTSPGYLVTEKAYSNYELSLEWRWFIDRENVLQKPGPEPERKSGVLFHIAGEADLVWPKSIKSQLRFGRAGDLQLINGFKLTLSPDRKDPNNAQTYLRSHDGLERPMGEWNTIVITCHGPFVSFNMNSIQIMTAKDAEFTKGRIALQSEAGEIHFRNITLKPLEGKPVDPDKDD